MASYLAPRLERIEHAYYPSQDDLWTAIRDEINEAMTMFIPKPQTKSKDSRPYITKRLHRLIKKKNQLYKRCKRKGSLHLEKRYNMYRHLVQKLLRKQQADYVDRLFTDEEKLKDQLTNCFGHT